MPRTPASPFWGDPKVRIWMRQTAARMKRGEIRRVTFDGIWRGGLKRRLYTAEGGELLSACKRAKQQSSTWAPPPDRIQVRLWDRQKSYVGALTWQQNERPRPLQRGEVPRTVGGPPSEVADPGVAAALRSFKDGLNNLEADVELLSNKLDRLKSRPTRSSPARPGSSVGPKEYRALLQRMEKMEKMEKECQALRGRVLTVENENQALRKGVEFLWRKLLMGGVIADTYTRLRKLYREQELYWPDTDFPALHNSSWPNDQ